MCLAQSQAILKLLGVFVLFTIFNKLAESWLEIWIAKATAVINHNSLTKGIILISASFITLQGASAVRMSYSSTVRMPPAVIATVVVDTVENQRPLKIRPWPIRLAILCNYSNARKCP